MAVPVWTLTKQAAQSNCSSFGIKDFTGYGGTFTARNLLALVLFITRTDKNGVRTLQTYTPDSADPLVVANWTINSTDDGLIEKILFAINIWNSGVTYATGDIIYNTSDSKFYKATNPGPNHIPPNGSFWAQITTDSLYANELANASTQMVITDQFDINSCRIETKINSEYQRVADNFISGVNWVPEYNQADQMDTLLQSAYSALNNGRPYEADEIIQGMTNYVLNYGALN